MVAPTTASCVCHTRAKNDEKLSNFTHRSWTTFVESAREWEEYDSGQKRQIAKKTEHLWDVKDFERYGYVYHRRCYQDFTNKVNQAKARKRHHLTAGGK